MSKQKYNICSKCGNEGVLFVRRMSRFKYGAIVAKHCDCEAGKKRRAVNDITTSDSRS